VIQNRVFKGTTFFTASRYSLAASSPWQLLFAMM
jgi:hypothetical protein